MVSAPLVLSGISIVLLIIYGADAIVGGGGAGDGFLPLDAMTRGVGLGIMIIIAGILIITGGAVVIGNADPVKAEESGRNVVSETMPIIIAGLIQIGLGILKIKKS